MSYGILCIERDKIVEKIAKISSTMRYEFSRVIDYHSELTSEEVSYNSLRFYIENELESQIERAFNSTSSEFVMLLFRIDVNHRSWGESFLVVYNQYDMLQVIRNYVLTGAARNLINGQKFSDQSIKELVARIIESNHTNGHSIDNEIETKLEEVDVNDELVEIYVQLKQLREHKELKTIYSLSLKNHVELLKKGLEVGLYKDNERIVKLYNTIKNTLLKTVKNEIANTVEEQETQLEKYKSKYL